MKRKRQSKKSAPVPSPGGSNATLFDQAMMIRSGVERELGGGPTTAAGEPETPLPQWYLNIIRQFSRTIFKPVLKLRSQGQINWRNFGKMIGIIERHKLFLKHDVPRIFEEALGDMTEAEWNRLEPLLGLDKLRAHLIKLLNRPVAADEPTEALAEESAQRHLEYLEKAKQNALFHVAQQDVCNTGLFYQGVSEGYTLFLDERGWFCGDRGRTEIYLNLIGCMIEVEKLRHTLPQKTRPQFYDDLAQVFRLTPRAHEWFNDVCDDIKFPIKSVGAPRKSAPVA